jgi:hypothetical protein
MSARALLERIDRIIVELEALRGDVLRLSEDAPQEPAADAGESDDFAPCHLLDTWAASSRFGHPQDTVRKWCRQGDGKRVGGRWMVSVPRVQRRLNGT